MNVTIETQQDLEQIHTTCKGCGFAVKDGKEQVGCALGRIEAFGKSVVPAEDTEEQFFVINGRNCNAKRNDAWVKAQLDSVAANSAVSVRERLSSITDNLKADSFARAVTNQGEQIERSLKRAMDDLRAQTVKPDKVFVLSNQDAMKLPKLVTLLREIGQGLDWQLAVTCEKEDDDSRVSKYRAVDILFPQITTKYYLFVATNVDIPHNLIEKLDEAVNVKMQQICAAEDAFGNDCYGKTGYLMRSDFHAFLNGSTPATTEDGAELNNIISKVRDIAREHSDKNVITTFAEILKEGE
jgi:hypothetical protein